MLLINGASVEVVNYLGQTPLWIAAKKGHTEMVKLLLQKSANVTVVSGGGKTPLWIAVQKGYEETVKAAIFY